MNIQRLEESLEHGTAISRRSVNKALIGFALAAVGIAGSGSLGGGAVSAQESSHYRTTSAVNLRTGPGIRRRVILVIPAKAMVVYAGESKYGFRKVSYQGTVGWAHGDYLEVTNGGSTDTPVPVGFAVTTAAVNFRKQPSTSSQVIRVLPSGTQVEVFDTFSGNFRMVGYAQQTGWVSQDFLSAEGVPASYLTTESALNLRAQPNTSASVILVIPKGSSVRSTDELSNGYRKVNFQGTNGWAFDTYLS